jgi:hypothetical protein
MKVLCYSPYNAWELHGQYEITILHALRLRGAEIKHVLCNGVFKACDMYWDATRPRHVMSCADCQAQSSSLSSRMGMPFTGLSKYIDNDEYEKSREFAKYLKPENYSTAKYGSWDIGEWVKNSVHLHIRTSDLNFSDNRLVEVYRDYIESGLVAAHGLSRIMDEFDPDILFLFNGKQSTLRVALEIAKKRKIETYLHERGAVYDTINIWKNTPQNWEYIRYNKLLWNKWKNIPLNNNEMNEVKNLVLNLQKGKGHNWKSFISADKISGQHIKNQFNIKSAERIWTIFTSSPDEMGGFEYRQIFDNQIDWIEETIKIAINRKQILFIRIHPNIGSKVSTGVNKGELKKLLALKNKFRNYKDLIKFILPDSEVNTYDLVEITDVGITYNSTIGLEMACMGKNVVVCAESFYDNLNNIWVLKNKFDYEDLLVYSTRLLNKATIKQEALRYAYFYYFVVNSIKFPYVKMTDPHNAVLNYNSLEDLLPGREENLDRICDYILHNKEIINVSNISDEELKKNKLIEAEHIQNSFVK